MSSASTVEPGERSISASETLLPGPGDVIEALTGELLVFALDSNGRRLPILSVKPGTPVVGCGETEIGTRFLVTGLPGTRVKVGQLASGVPSEQLHRWVHQLNQSVVAHDRPRRVKTLTEVGDHLAPGENVISDVSQSHDVGWIRCTSGSATLCGAQGAVLSPVDPAIPLTGGAWLRAGVRCRLQEVSAPSDPQGWITALDALGRLVIAAADFRQFSADRATLSRLNHLAEQSDDALRESIDVLASSVGGDVRVPMLADRGQTALLAAGVVVAGAAGLTITDVGLHTVGQEIDSGRDPVVALAAACGARSREVSLTPGWRDREGSPLLVQVRDGAVRQLQPRAMVWRLGGWVLIDPESGAESPVDDEQAESLEPGAVELVPVLPDQPSSIRQLLNLSLRGGRRDLITVGVVTALIGVASFITPYLLGQLAELFAGDAPVSAYVALFAMLIVVVIVTALWEAVRSIALLRLRSRGSSIAAGAVWDRSVRQRATWHDDHTLGDRLSQSSAVNIASASLPDATVGYLLDSVVVLGSLAAILTVGVPLAMGIALLLVAQIVVTVVILRVLTRRATERIEASAKATGRLIETLKAVNRLKVAGAETRAFLRWSQVQARFTRADQALRTVVMTQGVMISVWPVLGLLVIVAVVSITGDGFGAFITAQIATTAAIAAVAAAAMASMSTLVARQSIRKASPVLESAPEGGGDGAQPGVLGGAFEVRDIVYRYGPDLPPALNGVSLSVLPGEQVAIVGPSGCGKTTLMRIMLGLDEPESGVTLVDGRDLASLNRPAVRRQIGSVLQSSKLLPGVLRDNIAMGRVMSNAEIWQALDAVSVGDDVRQMPMGLDTPVTEGGGTLSGGQQQRVLIARALAGSPRILVLDEATSALDNLTQAAVVESLENLRITRIVVAHRLSTIRHADRIIVMDGGSVVDEGTYDELVSRPGPFYELAKRQQT